MNASPFPAVELAPQHKEGLRLHAPVMVSAGCYGLGAAYRGLVETSALGAVVVGPLTVKRRAGAAPPRAIPIPGGLLLHTGMANPGLRSALRRYRRTWENSPVPVILHLAALSPGEVTTACQQISAESIAAVELGLRDGIASGEVAALVKAARDNLRQPLIVRLPLADAAWLAPVAVETGADGLTVAAPPRGTVSFQGQLITGRLYGHFVHPLALRALRQVTKNVDVPLIGCGGVGSAKDGLAFLKAGATAIQIDAALWRDPSSPARISQQISLQGLDAPNNSSPP